MSSPYSASGNNGISVADAKAYIASIDTGQIADQISHYKTVATSLNQLAQSVTTINNNLQATWSGSAADAANTQFGTVAGQASNLASTLTDRVLPALTAAHTGAVNAQAAIKNVKDEVTQVDSPLNSITLANNGPGTQFIAPVVASQASAPPNNMNFAMTYDQALTFNSQQRAAAASAMNAVATPYTASAKTLTSIAGGLSQDVSTSPPPPTTGFTLTASPEGSGSNGAANGYQSTLGSGGSNGTPPGGSTGKTKLQSFVPPPPPPPFTVPPPPPTQISPPPPPIVLPPTSPVTSPPVGEPPVGDPVKTSPIGSNPVGSEPGGIDPVTGLPVGTGPTGIGAGADPAPGVFGEGGLPGGTGLSEGGLAGGTGSGRVPGSTSFGGPVSGGTEAGVIGGTSAGGTTQGSEQPVGMMGGGMSGGGANGGGSENSGPSASYLRGRYLGDGEGGSYTTGHWENPAIGGAEGVLIGGRPVEGAGVTSVYAGAQDSQGNPLGMVGSGGMGGSRSFGEENEESGSRPGYLKEDPQWWTPEGSYVPPVVE